MTEIRSGTRVAARDASGRWLEKVAVNAPHAGGDFAVVDVRWPDSHETTPWPMEDVVPLKECSQQILSHADYRAEVSPRREQAIEGAAVALRLADGDEMSGDYAYELAEATIAAYERAMTALVPVQPDAGPSTAQTSTLGGC